MAAPQPMPLGLQKLLSLDTVQVQERRSMLSNKFLVTTDRGERIFTARENTSGLARLAGGRDRPFDFYFLDENEQNVVSVRRPYCFSGCSKMEVSVCGTVASIVRQEATFLKPLFNINDPQDRPVLRIKGHESFGNRFKYELQSVDKTPLGRIKHKQKWTELDQYLVSFPADLDVRYKITVIATCILIDTLYHD